jgi:alkanesulfonate monooxygenase SsuD/methylene tetrahydromethanopterin reductase-like flavin-dependent oxidoreductase (luciferase family)
MKFGLQLISTRDRDASPSAALDKLVEASVEAERLGYWSVWTTEHHFQSTPDYRPFGVSLDQYPSTDYDMSSDPLMVLGWIAAKTSRLRLGTAVSVLHWDHPIRTVERAAILDALSHGRLEFGVGRGLGFREAVVFGVPGDQSANEARYHEAVEIIRRAWAGERFSFDGDYYQVPELGITPPPERQPAPLFIGSASNNSAVWAARNNLPYATITWPLVGIDIYKAKREAYLAAGEEAGYDLSANPCPHFLFSYCGETDEQAAEVVDEYMTKFQFVIEQHYELARQHDENEAATTDQDAAFPAASKDPFAVIKKLASYPIDYHIVGSPKTCIERVRMYQEEAGVNYIVLVSGYADMPRDLHLGSLRRFAEQVMPHFAEESAAVA